ncbi:MAG: pilus assembly protein [Marinobacterium sp.]|nr:pilus assembly protein [Marinobacterium sp.]
MTPIVSGPPVRMSPVKAARQRGSIYVLEFTWVFILLLSLVLGMLDLTRYMQYREQLQNAAFSVATVLSNRDYYYGNSELLAYAADIDGDNTAEIQLPGRPVPGNDYDALKALAVALMPEGARVGLEIEQWQESVAAPSVVRRAFLISNPGCSETAPAPSPPEVLLDTQAVMVTPVYVVRVCNLKAWSWLSHGFLGGAFETIAGNRYRAVAVMSSRNSHL